MCYLFHSALYIRNESFCALLTVKFAFQNTSLLERDINTISTANLQIQHQTHDTYSNVFFFANSKVHLMACVNTAGKL